MNTLKRIGFQAARLVLVLFLVSIKEALEDPSRLLLDL